MLTRRDWIRTTGQAALVTAIGARATEVETAPGSAPAFCLFSKHLPDLGWSDLGRAVKDAGFDGVDLTVRAKGHVLPEKAATDLPRALEAIKAHGVSVPMVTTELKSASDPTARPLLKAAASNGVRYFKVGYWLYAPNADVRAQVATVGDDLRGLADLAREYGIEMGFHNHAGYVGAALWDIAPSIEKLDPKWAGFYFDPRHAVAEGGGGAWKAATALVSSRLKMMAVKDFFWEKTPKGWTIQNCPLGEGMVDWSAISTALSAAKFGGPISVHLEYEIPGATPEERTKRTLDAAIKDLAYARRSLQVTRTPA